MSIAFSATIAAGFLIFIWTSSDVFCKKLFLFISYSNLFCIFHFVAVLICNALFPSMSGIEMQYARNIARTLLYIPTVLAYLKFLRPRIRTVPVRKKADMVFHLPGFHAVPGCVCVFRGAFLSVQQPR